MKADKSKSAADDKLKNGVFNPISKTGMEATGTAMVAQASQPAVSRVSKPASAGTIPAAPKRRGPADWEVGDTAGSETCATKNGAPISEFLFKEHYKDGTLSCVGKFRDGAKNGVWKHYLRNGQLRAVGKFAGGKMTGEWKWYRESGALMQTGSFVAEKKSRVWKRYHPNGALYDEGEFSDNQKVGEWRVYDATGKLIKTTKHKTKPKQEQP